MDGGTILGDACCGWNDFAESFRREIELIFPGRPLHADAARGAGLCVVLQARRFDL